MNNSRKYLLIWTLLLGLVVPAFSQQYNESNDFSYALKLYNEGFYDPAAQQFSKFINRYPGSERIADAHFYYGESLLKLQEYEDARIEFQDLAVSFPDHHRAPQGWMKVGESYELLGKGEEAAKAYETVKILYPQDALAPQGLLKAAGIYMEIDQVNRAEQILRDFLNRYLESSEYPRGRVLYGRLLIKKREYERAGSEFRRVAETSSDKQILAEARLGEATVFQQLGLYKRAESTLEEIIKSQSGTPQGFEAVMTLSSVYQDNREWDKAVAVLRQALAKYNLQDQQEQLKLTQVRVLILKEDYFAARRLLEELKTSGDRKLAQLAVFYQACCDLEEQRFDAAGTGFQNTLQSELDSGYQMVALLNLARLHLRQGDFQAARQYLSQYQAANSGDPGLEALHRDLIELAFRNKLLSAGVDELQRYRGAYPNSLYRDDLIFAAGKAFFRDRQYDRSLIFFEQVRDEYTASASWDSSQAYIRFINTYYKSGQQAGVNELARLMGKMLTGAERSQMLYELGGIYIRDLKDYEEAAAIFEKYVGEASDSSALGEGYYYLSESYLRSAEYREFLGQPATDSRRKAGEALKKAITYVNHSPRPDTLTYRFLSATVPPGSDPAKFLQLWQHFETRYPASALLPQVRLFIAGTLLAGADTTGGLAYLDKILAARRDPYITGLAYWKKAQILEKQGTPEVSIRLLKDFLLENPGHPYQARGYQALSRLHAAKGEYELAAQFLERLMAQFNYAPEAETAPGLITDNYIRSGAFEKALAYVEPKINRGHRADDPVAQQYLFNPEAAFYFYAGKAYYQQQDFHQARQQLLRYLGLSQSGGFQSEALLLMGKMAHAEGDRESALLHFSLIKKEDDPQIYYQANTIAADILMKQGNYAQAQLKYDALIPLAAKEDERLVLEADRVRALINQGKTSLAESQTAALKNAHKSNPRLDNYLAAIEYEYARVDYGNKQFDAAINHCKNILKRYKKSDYADDAQYLIGRSYATLNRAKDAIKEFNEFIKDYPGSELSANVYMTVAEIHFRGEALEEGIAAVEQAVAVANTPETSQAALSMLIASNKRMGSWDKVLRNAREYLSRFPNAADAVDKKITVGNALIRLNRYVEAVDYLKSLKFEVDSEREPEIQFYIGEAYFNAGQYDNAINEFLKIPLLSQKTKLPWEASAFYFAGQSYEKLGRSADAIRMYQEILDRPGIERDLKLQARKLIDKLNNLN